MMPPLHVIGAYYSHRPDPLVDRQHTRLSLLYKWAERLLDTRGVKVTIVEHTIGERPYELSPDDPRLKHVQLFQLRGVPEHEHWISWSLLNYGLGHQPEDARYLCWQDTDITHTRSDWAELTVDMLQLHRIGQTWTTSVDLDPRGNQIANERGDMVDRSFSAAWLSGDSVQAASYGATTQAFKPQPGEKVDVRAHPGYSVAIRKSALQGIGRLIDWDLTGSSDWHMFRAFTGTLNQFDHRMTPAFNRKLREFAARCDEHIRQDIGVVPGLILAGWHGRKRDRYYIRRNEVMQLAAFDPDIDITYDVNGIPTLCTDNRALRDGLRRYNAARHEDSIDV